MSSIEDRIIRDVQTAICQEFGDTAQVMVCMFDGLVVQLKAVDNAARLRRVLDMVGQREGIGFTMDVF